MARAPLLAVLAAWLIACGDDTPEITIIEDDDNDSFAEAVEVQVDGESVHGIIGKPGDHDFFRFEAAAGSFYRLTTLANRADDPALVDTVMRLYDAGEARIGQADDAVPRIGRDSQLVIRRPDDGTVYIEILDWFEWAGMEPRGDRTFSYDVIVEELTADDAGVLIDGEPGNDAASATAAAVDMNGGLVLGALDASDDVDVFRIDVPPGGGSMFIDSAIGAPGADGNGSTASIDTLTLTDLAGTSVVARSDGMAGRLSPPITAGESYLVFIAHDPVQAVGANPFYAYSFSLRDDDVPELEQTPGENDTLATAETLVPGGDRFFIVAELPTAGDVDYFAFPAFAGTTIGFNCVAARAGSAVRDLAVDLRGPSDEVLASATETVSADLDVAGTPAAGDGAHYLVLRSSGPDPSIASAFVRCGVRFNE